jgi:hypothetical protein
MIRIQQLHGASILPTVLQLPAGSFHQLPAGYICQLPTILQLPAVLLHQHPAGFQHPGDRLIFSSHQKARLIS